MPSLKPFNLTRTTENAAQTAIFSSPPQAIAVSPVRYFRIAPETRTRTIVSPYSSAVEDELAQARIARKKYQSTRKRDAVYEYLRAVFKIVRRWRKEHRAQGEFASGA
jgi:hypothetical protein